MLTVDPNQIVRSLPSRILLAMALLLPARSATAQEAWEYSPYRIHIWLATDHSPRLAGLLPQLEQTLRQQARVLAGSTWQISSQSAPRPLRMPILASADALTTEQVEQFGKDLHDRDKLWIVGISADGSGYHVVARELDLATKVWSPLIERRCRLRELLAQQVFAAAAATFTPLARIEDVQGLTAKCRVRAAGLVVDNFCPSLVRVNDVMTTVVRINDRNGQPRPDGIREIEWTLLHVNQVDGAHAQCAVHSINRGYLGGRTSSRIHRYGMPVRRESTRTTVKLLSKTDPPQPLAGYEIYSKNPITEESTLVGHTDWRGAIEIKPLESAPLQVLYVRSGATLLARLPIVAGETPVATAQLLDDENRLHAEGLARSLQAALIDRVAERELLAARIRKLIKDSKLAEAEKLVDRYRTLPTLSDLRMRLDRARQEVATDNPRVQARIDQLFADVQAQLVKFVNPNQVDLLAAELSKAQGR